jgi:hypothetical protein
MRVLKIMIVIALFWSCNVAMGDTQQSSDEKTLCEAGEDIYFSCPLSNGKTVSVCAKGNSDPRRGYVQYRYGDQNNIFAFPKKNIPPDKIFKTTDISEGSIRGLHLKFSNGEYTYVVSVGQIEGLYVSRRGKIVFSKECQPSIYSSFPNKIWDGINQAPMSDVDIH